MSRPVVVRVDNVSKRFVIRKDKSLKERVVNRQRSNTYKEDFWALRDVDLEIHSGATVGLIGPNGSGKSTLLKMVSGILLPDRGSVQVRGRLAALLELGAGFHPDLTGRENVYINASILGLSRSEIDRYFDAIVDFSGIEQFIDTQVKFYSSGMYVRLAFAVAVHVDPDILLVDEVLAVGDEPFQRKCLERIRTFQSEGRTIVLVTHGLDQVAEFCDRAVVLEQGQVVADGSAREGLKKLRADFEAHRQEESARSAGGAGTPKAVFTGISLRTPEGDEQHPTIEPGGTLLVAMETRAETRVEAAEIGVAITTPLGLTLYSTTSSMLDSGPVALDGTQHFVFGFPGLPLAPGEYAVRTTLTTPNGDELHTVPVAGEFSVEGAERSRGPVAVDASFNKM
ncbi:ATP-binding cassette domain-containing protein [Cellulomonas sp. JZ18]|uniref:ABC transporter ATP-binding protein n=1 Tax=Cellulomonas sp. JZ18 TaxID=2654191 RepID=UPI0012D383A0|nr:ABC transporter ATP-binding protein [Cellulomonas sp. JZ18]QGQ18876.1 ATP-binding cassette domain-containing protein [Cellulomonas sp. JZ18]